MPFFFLHNGWPKHLFHSDLTKLRSKGSIFSADTCFLSAPTMDSMTEPEKAPNHWKIHIPENTLAFSLALCGVFITTFFFTEPPQSERRAQIKFVTFFWTRYSTVALQESAQGQTGVQGIPSAGSRSLIWFVSDLLTIHERFICAKNTAGSH